MITEINFELLICISYYLNGDELIQFSSCHRHFYGLRKVDSIWKRLCRFEFGIRYNDPNRTYRQLYFQCKTKKYGRLPCTHLEQQINIENSTIKKLEVIEDTTRCQRCFLSDQQYLFICLSSDCNHRTLCDRHARLHTIAHDDDYHSIFYKPNMSELFCQLCVDWLGGIETDPAEKYYTALITNHWSLFFNSNEHDELVKRRNIRQLERSIRRRDTPHYIMSSEKCCFISSTWMAAWEIFIEGWETHPPKEHVDQTGILDALASDRICANPFYLHASNKDALVISKSAWDYIASKYQVNGNMITEDDLKPKEKYISILKRIEFWKKKVDKKQQRLVYY